MNFSLVSNKRGGGAFNYLCTYDLYGPVHNVFDAGRHIMWGSGGGGGGEVGAIGSCISQGPTKLQISSANPHIVATLLDSDVCSHLHTYTADPGIFPPFSFQLTHLQNQLIR